MAASPRIPRAAAVSKSDFTVPNWPFSHSVMLWSLKNVYPFFFLAHPVTQNALNFAMLFSSYFHTNCFVLKNKRGAVVHSGCNMRHILSLHVNANYANYRYYYITQDCNRHVITLIDGGERTVSCTLRCSRTSTAYIIHKRRAHATLAKLNFWWLNSFPTS